MIFFYYASMSLKLKMTYESLHVMKHGKTMHNLWKICINSHKLGISRFYLSFFLPFFSSFPLLLSLSPLASLPSLAALYSIWGPYEVYIDLLGWWKWAQLDYYITFMSFLYYTRIFFDTFVLKWKYLELPNSEWPDSNTVLNLIQ